MRSASHWLTAKLGIGIAQGYATLGTIGFEGRSDYGAIGTVTNLAARLCAAARGGEILASQRVVASVAGKFATNRWANSRSRASRDRFQLRGSWRELQRRQTAILMKLVLGNTETVQGRITVQGRE